MKKLVLDSSVQISLRTLDPDGEQRMRAWFTRLQHWDTDEEVRKNSVELVNMPGIYILYTTTNLRIFFQIDGDTVTVLELANQKAILASGRNSGGT